MSKIILPNAEEKKHYGKTEDVVLKAMREEYAKLKEEHEKLKAAVRWMYSDMIETLYHDCGLERIATEGIGDDKQHAETLLRAMEEDEK